MSAPHADLKMPWGKYKGQCLSDIPVYYLDWLIGWEGMDEGRNSSLKVKITTHLKSRADWDQMDNPSAKDDDSPYLCPTCLEEMTASGYCVHCEKYPYQKE